MLDAGKMTNKPFGKTNLGMEAVKVPQFGKYKKSLNTNMAPSQASASRLRLLSRPIFSPFVQFDDVFGLGTFRFGLCS